MDEKTRFAKIRSRFSKEKAVEFYKMVGDIHVKNELNSRLKMIYPSTIRIRQIVFKNNDGEKILNEYKENVIDGYKQLPISNFTLDYMGNGKLLFLETMMWK